MLTVSKCPVRNKKLQALKSVGKLCITFGCRRFIKIPPVWEVAVPHHFPSMVLIRVVLLFVIQTEILASHQVAWYCVSLAEVAFDLQG